jgi:hypothetical protein
LKSSVRVKDTDGKETIASAVHFDAKKLILVVFNKSRVDVYVEVRTYTGKVTTRKEGVLVYGKTIIAICFSVTSANGIIILKTGKENILLFGRVFAGIAKQLRMGYMV